MDHPQIKEEYGENVRVKEIKEEYCENVRVKEIKEEYCENVRVKEEPVDQGVRPLLRVSVQNKVGFSSEIKNTFKVMGRDERRGWRRRRRSGEYDEEDFTPRVKEENPEDAGGSEEAGYATGFEVDEVQMAGLDVGQGTSGAQEVETESSDEVEDDAVGVTDKDRGELVLVQHHKYKWPALILGREGTRVKVQLFNKNRKEILVDPDDVSEFVYMDHTNSNLNELKNGFKMARLFKASINI